MTNNKEFWMYDDEKSAESLLPDGTNEPESSAKSTTSVCSDTEYMNSFDLETKIKELERLANPNDLNLVDGAIYWAAKGYRPVRAGFPDALPDAAKRPSDKGWQTENHARSPVEAAELWSRSAPHNISLLCQTHLEIDVDKHNGATGPEDLTLMESELGPLPSTPFYMISPSGGRHYPYRLPWEAEQIKAQSHIKFHDEPTDIDIRINNSLAVAAPSSYTLNGEPVQYKVIGKVCRPEELPELPRSWIDYFVELSSGKSNEKAAVITENHTSARQGSNHDMHSAKDNGASLGLYNTDADEENDFDLEAEYRELTADLAARKLLGHEKDKDIEKRAIRAAVRRSHYDRAISGQGGHDRLMAFASFELFGLDLPQELGTALVEYYNEHGCDPPFSPTELQHKIADAISGKGAPFKKGFFRTRTVKNGLTLHCNSKGSVSPTKKNLRLIMEDDPRYSACAGWNELAYRLELLHDVDYLKEGDLCDKQFRSIVLLDLLDRYGVDFHEDDLKTVIIGLFPKNRFNPFQDYVDTQVWDHVPRVETLLIDCFNCEDNCFTREAPTKWLIAAYARQREPGLKFDYVLTLPGAEGQGKSGFSIRLFDPLNLGLRGWNVDGMSLKAFIDPKLFCEATAGKVCVELAELAGNKRVDVEEFKAACTLRARIVRMAYAEQASCRMVQQVYLVTTNEQSFLSSLTGNRRFWIIPCNLTPQNCRVYDLLTQKYVAQIWAEVKYRYDEMCDEKGCFDSSKLLLSSEAAQIAFQAQESARVQQPFEPNIARYLGNVQYYRVTSINDGKICAKPIYYHYEQSTAKIWEHSGTSHLSSKAMTTSDARLLSAFLTRLGWTKKVVTISEEDGCFGPKKPHRCNGYVRPESDSKPIELPIQADIVNQYEPDAFIDPDKIPGYSTAPQYWNY